MLVELSIIPLGGKTHLSERLAEVLAEIDASGLRYRLTPEGTCIEGSWEEVMPVVRSCHQIARKRSEHVVTFIKIDDEEGTDNKLEDNVRSLEEKTGRKLERLERGQVRLGPRLAL